MSNRPAYITLPGLSVTTVLLNLPCVLSLTDDLPIIFIDVNDYDRLRREILEDESNSQKAPYLLTAYEELRQRDIVRLIDYTKFYEKSTQDHYLQRNKNLIEESPDWVNRRIAVKEVESWIEYGRGNYQEEFRDALGESSSAFGSLRQGDKKQWRKMEAGTGNPIEWNEKVLNKGTAALAVRRQANRDLDVKVKSVITGPEHEIIGDFLNATQTSGDWQSPPERFGLDNDIIDSNAAHLTGIDPTNKITGFSPTEVTQTREVLDTVTEIATDETGVQYNDWFLLGPILTLPRYNDIFEFNRIKEEIQSEDIDRVATEATQIITEVDSKIDNNLSPTKLRYKTNWITEEYDLDTSYSESQGRNIGNMINHASYMSQYSDEFRNFRNQGANFQSSIFIGINAIKGRTQQLDKNDIHKCAKNIISRLDPTSPNRMGLEEVHKQRQGATWKESPDWYEMIDRDR